MANNVRKQGQKKLELFGSYAVEFDYTKEFTANTFNELETQFNKHFAIK